MRLKWTGKALDDLARLYEFLAAVNKPAAARTVQSLTDAPTRLLEQPIVGRVRTARGSPYLGWAI